METAVPTFESYGKYSSSNYGAHTLVFSDAKGNKFYFSYETLVAFIGSNGLVVRENNWGPTTGKHLNWIDGGNKKQRVNEEKFNQILHENFKSEDIPSV